MMIPEHLISVLLTYIRVFDSIMSKTIYTQVVGISENIINI